MTEENRTPEPSEKKRLWIPLTAVAAVAVLIGGLVLISGGGDDEGSPEADGDGGSTSAHQEDVLVTTDWLEEHLDDPGVAIVEVSENRPDNGLTSYEEGHIPGAVELVWFDHFMQQVNRDVVDREGFTELAQEAGIDDDSTVVLYGDADNWFAAWGAWVFKLYGAEDVRLLDGGRDKWEDEDQPLDNVAPSPQEGDFEATEANDDIRALQPEVLESAEADGPDQAPADLVDIRGPEEYNGEIAVAEGFDGEAAVKLGHIPNAVNVPWAEIVDDDGAYLPADEIADVYAEAGVEGDKPIIVYCRIGERASHTWYALSQILGYDVQLYDGSWTEWGNSVGVPVQNNSDEERSGLWS